MAKRKFNWPVWTGFLISLIAFASYFTLFVKFPVTRDFPWANLLLFAVALAFLALGIRRAFSRGLPHPLRSKILGSTVAAIGVAVCVMFVVSIFVLGRDLPASNGAPKVGQHAPDFALIDSNSKPVTLAELRGAPVNDKPLKGVLLVFYRGYW